MAPCSRYSIEIVNGTNPGATTELLMVRAVIRAKQLLVKLTSDFCLPQLVASGQMAQPQGCLWFPQALRCCTVSLRLQKLPVVIALTTQLPGPSSVPKIMAQYPKTNSISSIGSIILGILEVQLPACLNPGITLDPVPV